MPRKTKTKAAAAQTTPIPTPLQAISLNLDDWMDGWSSLKILQSWAEDAYSAEGAQRMLGGVCVRSFTLILKELMVDLNFNDGGLSDNKWAEACSCYFVLVKRLMQHCGNQGIDLCRELTANTDADFSKILDAAFGWVCNDDLDYLLSQEDGGRNHVAAMTSGMQLLHDIAAKPAYGTLFAYKYYESFSISNLTGGIVDLAKYLIHNGKENDDEWCKSPSLTVGNAKSLGCSALFTITDILCWTRTRPADDDEKQSINNVVASLIDAGIIELAVDLQKYVLERVVIEDKLKPFEGKNLRRWVALQEGAGNVLFWEAFAACLIPNLKASIDVNSATATEMTSRLCGTMQSTPNLVDVTISRLRTTPRPSASCLYRMMMQLAVTQAVATPQLRSLTLTPTLCAIVRESLADAPSDDDPAFAATHRFAGILFAVRTIIPTGNANFTRVVVEHALSAGILNVVTVEFSRLARQFEELQKTVPLSLSKNEMDKLETGVHSALDFLKVLFDKALNGSSFRNYRANFLVENCILEQMEQIKWWLRHCSKKAKVVGMFDEIDSMLHPHAGAQTYATHDERRSRFALEKARGEIESEHARLCEIRTAAGVDELMPERPREHNCPIFGELMLDPVVAEDGHSYERSAISHWLARGKKTSPLTNLPMGEKLVKNETLRIMISNFEMDAHKKAMDHVSAPPLRAEKRKRDKREGDGA